MIIGTDVVQGVIKINNFMEGQCFTSIEDFIRKLPTILAVELPTGITNVSVGNIIPSDSERGNLWIKTDGSGNFIGICLYINGDWRQIFPIPFPVIPLYRVVGDSRDIPDGFELASNDARLTSTQVSFLQSQWLIGGTGPTWYQVFDCTYIGF